MTVRPPVWLVVAHGSRLSEVAAAHAEVCDAIAGQVGDQADVRAAYLEITEPSIPTAIADAVADGATDIVLVPYFLHVGRHTNKDLPELLAAAADRHSGVRFKLADHLGLDDRLVAVAIDRAREAGAPDSGASGAAG